MYKKKKYQKRTGKSFFGKGHPPGSVLRCVVQPQLGHLTAHALQHGQEVSGGGAQQKAATTAPVSARGLAVQEVRHHLCKLGSVDWFLAIWKNTEMVQTSELYCNLCCLPYSQSE